MKKICFCQILLYTNRHLLVSKGKNTWTSECNFWMVICLLCTCNFSSFLTNIIDVCDANFQLQVVHAEYLKHSLFFGSKDQTWFFCCAAFICRRIVFPDVLLYYYWLNILEFLIKEFYLWITCIQFVLTLSAVFCCITSKRVILLWNDIFSNSFWG